MYFWHINDLMYSLKNSRPGLINSILYLFMHGVSLMLGIHLIQLLPTLYHLTFGYLKTYLENAITPLPLYLNVYSYFDEHFLLINYALVFGGIIFCLLVHKGPLGQFFGRFIALSWTICFRMMLITCILFLLGIITGGIYFYYKFFISGQTFSSVPPVIAGTFKSLFKATGILPAIKSLASQAQALPRTQEIFNQLNTLSYNVYWIAQIGASLSTLWWMLSIQEKIRELQK